MPVVGNGPQDPLLALLDALPDAVVVTDRLPPHRIQWVGGGFRELTGEESDDVRGRELLEVCTSASADAIGRLAQALAAGESADDRILWRDPRGRVVPLSIRVIPVPGSSAGETRAAWLARPDTSRVLAQIDEALYSYVLDRDGGAELVYASPRFEALIDSSPAAMASIDAWRARIHQDDRALGARERARAARRPADRTRVPAPLRGRSGTRRARPCEPASAEAGWSPSTGS